MIRDQQTEFDCQEPFARVAKKYEVPPFLSHHTQDVRCADVSAPVLTDIDALPAGH
jgi:hypothetical protein